MEDLINRQMAINVVLDRMNVEKYGRNAKPEEIQWALDRLPSAQPEQKKGHWIPVTNGRGGHQCDRCGCYAPSYQSGTEWLSNFCPECNADMRGETE